MRNAAARSVTDGDAAGLEALLVHRLADFSPHVPPLADAQDKLKHIRRALCEGDLSGIICGRVERRTLTLGEVFERRYREPP